MYYSQSEIINLKLLADKATTDSKILLDLINADRLSKLKSDMNEGERYYQGKHDYLTHQNLYYPAEGSPIKMKNKANNLSVVQFYTLAEDQKIEYMLGKQPTVSIKEQDIMDENNPTPEEQKAISLSEQFQTAINAELTKKFYNILNNSLHSASRKSLEWLHFYIDTQGNLQYVITPAQGIIPIYDIQYENKLIEIIRYYEFELIDTTRNERVTRYKVERWNEKTVTYYQQDYDGNFFKDLYYETNPYPHWMDTNETLGIQTPNNWGRVPFVPIYNNSQGTNDLQPIKALIDVYDAVFSGWANDLEDIKQLILVLKGYEGLAHATKQGLIDLENFLTTLFSTGAIPVSEEGDVTNLKNEIPVEAREKFLEKCEKLIYKIGRMADPTALTAGNITNVAIKALYAGLDAKANAMLSKLDESLEEAMWFIIFWMNKRDRTNYDYKQIKFTYNKTTIFNEAEYITILNATRVTGDMSLRTYLEKNPLIDDVDEEEARLAADQERKNAISANNIASVPDSNKYDSNGVIIQNPDTYTGKMFDSMGKEIQNMMAQA